MTIVSFLESVCPKHFHLQEVERLILVEQIDPDRQGQIADNGLLKLPKEGCKETARANRYATERIWNVHGMRVCVCVCVC